jgi:hypothetical protein
LLVLSKTNFVNVSNKYPKFSEVVHRVAAIHANANEPPVTIEQIAQTITNRVSSCDDTKLDIQQQSSVSIDNSFKLTDSVSSSCPRIISSIAIPHSSAIEPVVASVVNNDDVRISLNELQTMFKEAMLEIQQISAQGKENAAQLQLILIELQELRDHP